MGRLQPIIICALILTFPVVVLSVANPAGLLAESAFAIPFLIFALVAFLGIKMSQRRTLAIAVFFMLGYGFLLQRGSNVAIVAASLPLYLCLVFLFREGRWGVRADYTYFSIAAVPSLALFLFSSMTLSRGWPVAELSLVLCVLFAIMTLFETDRFVRDFRIFILLGIVPVFYLLARTGQRGPASLALPLETALGFASSGAMLFYGMFRLYWRKIFLDELTGIPNRRALNNRLLQLKGEYAIAMLDIDHFKKINDTYGHGEGDHVLRYVAYFLERESGSRAYRYGGEEFCVVWEGISPENALKRVDRIRSRMADKPFFVRARLRLTGADAIKQRGKTSREKTELQVTVSAGVAAPSGRTRRPEDALIAADQALYRAKMMGRNCTILAQQDG